MFLYVKVIILGLLLSGAAFGGWYVEHLRFEAFKTQVESLGKEAEIKNQAIQSEHQQAIKVLQDEHDAKLNLIRQYYANGVYNSCLLYTSPSPRDRTRSRMPSSA